MTQRNTLETIHWFQNNEVYPPQIGFDPDGMCQKIARVARFIGPGYGSALAQQQATPMSLRVYDVAKAVRGMVAFFDDPNDDNPYGHIATLVGRVANADRDDLGDCLFRTNAVVSNRIVVVRGDYFGKNWGDAYQFFGKTLNGVVLDLPEKKAPEPDPLPTLPPRGVKRLEHMLDVYDEMIENHKDRPRFVRAFREDKKEIRETLRILRLTQKEK